MHRRGFVPIIILIVAAILAVGIGAYAWLGVRKAVNTPNVPVARQQAASSTNLAQASSTTGASSTTPVIDTSHWVQYRNFTFGYSFKYPQGYSLAIDIPDLQVIASKPSSSQADVIKSGWMQVSVPLAGNSYWQNFSSERDFIDAAYRDLQSYCSYSGPNESMLTDVVSESTSTNQNGIFYYKANFKFVSSGNPAGGGKAGTKVLGVVGPFYALDMTKQTPGLGYTVDVLPTVDINCSATSLQPESKAVDAFIDNISY